MSTTPNAAAEHITATLEKMVRDGLNPLTAATAHKAASQLFKFVAVHQEAGLVALGLVSGMVDHLEKQFQVPRTQPGPQAHEQHHRVLRAINELDEALDDPTGLRLAEVAETEIEALIAGYRRLAKELGLPLNS